MGSKRKLVGLVIRETGEPVRPQRYSRLHLRPDTADLVRKVARATGKSLDDTLHSMVRAYAEHEHPEWTVMEYEDDDK